MVMLMPEGWNADPDRNVLIHWCGFSVALEDYRTAVAVADERCREKQARAQEDVPGTMVEPHIEGLACLQHECDADSQDAYASGYRRAYQNALDDERLRRNRQRPLGDRVRTNDSPGKEHGVIHGFPTLAKWIEAQTSPLYVIKPHAASTQQELEDTRKAMADMGHDAVIVPPGMEVEITDRRHLKVTTEVPTEPGWYRCRQVGYDEWECAHLRKATGLLRFDVGGEDIGPDLSDYEWGGRIEMPGEVPIAHDVRAIDPERFREELAKIAAPTPEGAAAMRRLGIEVLDRDPRAQALIKARASALELARQMHDLSEQQLNLLAVGMSQETLDGLVKEIENGAKHHTDSSSKLLGTSLRNCYERITHGCETPDEAAAGTKAEIAAFVAHRKLHHHTEKDGSAYDARITEDTTPHAGIKIAGGDGRGGQPPMLAIRKARGAEKPGEELTLQRYDGSKVEPEPVTGGGGGSSSPAHRPHFRIKSMKLDGVEYAPRRRYANMAEVDAHLGPDKATDEEAVAAVEQAEVECRAAEAERKAELFHHPTMEEVYKHVRDFAVKSAMDFERMDVLQISTDAHPFGCILEVKGDNVTDEDLERLRPVFAGILPGHLKPHVARWGEFIERDLPRRFPVPSSDEIMRRVREDIEAEPRVPRLATEEDLKKPGADKPGWWADSFGEMAPPLGVPLLDLEKPLTNEQVNELTSKPYSESGAWLEANVKNERLRRFYAEVLAKHTCDDCQGSGRYVGALEVTACHECGGTGWAK